MELSFTKKYKFKIIEQENKQKIWCLVRQDYYQLTPEEWVRQHWLKYLTQELAYPRNSIVLEKIIKWNNQPKRADIVVYKNQKAFILIECKAPRVVLSEKTIDQLSMYNFYLNANYLVISNGLNHIFLEKENEQYVQVKNLPLYL